MRNFEHFILAGYSVGREIQLDHFIQLSLWDVQALSQSKKKSLNGGRDTKEDVRMIILQNKLPRQIVSPYALNGFWTSQLKEVQQMSMLNATWEQPLMLQ